ncbi:MAG: ABC transporter ATP-binding protein [Pseudomonadota bacterium]
MSAVVADGIFKFYGEMRVLERVNIDVTSGTFCTIVGASGCGKSTFLRMLLGQETPSSGEILLDGEVLPPEPTTERGIVFQRYSVFPNLSVIDNLLLATDLMHGSWSGRVFGKRRREERDRAHALLEKIGLNSAATRYPAQLSGGMQQRLAIAQTLMNQPKVLLMDEPFGALDPGIRDDMQELILDIWREHKMTVFMVTHDISEAFKLGTRLIVFDKVRVDPDYPNAYGATITYDLDVSQANKSDDVLPDALPAALIEGATP